AASRSAAGRLAAAWRQPAWRLEQLGALIEPLGPDVRHAVARLARGDCAAAHEALREHYRERESRFPVPSKRLGRIAERVRQFFPSAAASALEEARAIDRGRFDLLGYEALDFRSPGASAPRRVDWQWDPVHRRRPPVAWWSRVPYLDPASGDHKIIWELNRHQHFLRLGRAAWLAGDPACRRTFVTHLRGWLEQNPPRIGVNWASMLELSFRSLSWLWALHFFAPLPGGTREEAEDPWIPDLLLGLHAQLEHVRDNLSRYFSPNTHLTGEALGLYVCGRALPELRASSAWADTGREVLIEQIDRQIARDGGHCERSTHYHRYTLDFYLVALAFARATGDPCAGTFADAAERTAEAAAALADSTGRLPLIGDDDGGRLFPVCPREPNDVRDSLALAAVLLNRPDLAVGPGPEEPMWLVGETAAGRRAAPGAGREEAGRGRTSTALPDTGYYISRPRGGDHMVFDVGPHGFLNGGHAHADALSLVCSMRGRPLAIDPGTATYTMSPALRDRLRSSPAHNTLTIDGRSQSVPKGPFHWRNAAASRVQAWSSGDGYDYFEGVHDGYRPIVHRRRVVALASGGLVVVDSVLGEGEHQADVYWHLAPDWRPEPGDGGVVALGHEDGGRAALVVPDAEIAVLTGDDDPGLGWHSPVYGRLLPSPTIRLRRRGLLPLTLVSVFADVAAGGVSVELLAPIDLPGRADDDSIAVQLETAGRRELLVFTARPPLLPGDDATAAPAPTPGARFAWGDREVTASARFAWLSWSAEKGIGQHAADEGDITLDDRRRAAGAA
ncbi:MAG TPA: alginate lyase family protein, partial [Vicinamibacterales bacterium]|nr:alginate lyase family protein [Vicinamibacterales bacterium]